MGEDAWKKAREGGRGGDSLATCPTPVISSSILLVERWFVGHRALATAIGPEGTR